MARDEPDFVLKSVMELCHNGFAKLSRNKPMVVNPFSVSTQSNGKLRLIADLRHLNQFLKMEKFKLDDIQSAMPALKQAKFMFSFDLTKAYYHMDLDKEVQQFFGFSFTYKGQKYYRFYTICLFGLSTLPRGSPSSCVHWSPNGKAQASTSTYIWMMVWPFASQKKR